MQQTWSFYEFFAGAGMARAGLGQTWSCLFANDFDRMKADTYRNNWGEDHFAEGDVAQVKPSDLPGVADMIWASFPCQDLSLAGKCIGLGDSSADYHTRSGTFWPFWSLVRSLISEGRGPKIIALENVKGTITSRGGRDFAAICSSLAEVGYRFGAMVIDAVHFVPQSRPRVFFVAVAANELIPNHLLRSQPDPNWHPEGLCSAVQRLPEEVRHKWVWFALSKPPGRDVVLADLIDEVPVGCRWNTIAETNKLLDMMTPSHLAKIASAKLLGKRQVGAVYRRTRADIFGVKKQRAEIRFDDVAGCLRTPGGGSSRQTIVVVEGESVRSRLLSPREAARLMGLDDEFLLPERYNDAYKVAGDGVCVPVVRFLSENLFEPILKSGACENQWLAA